ncbi:MAG: STAS domain-containing protein [Calditrichaeota bacterium]|nr:MAG: STAS domain-containing protein [Calditrichota bacterium]
MKNNDSQPVSLRQKKQEVLQLWIESPKLLPFRQRQWDDDSLQQETEKVLAVLLDALNQNHLENFELEESGDLKAVLSDFARQRAQEGYSPQEILVYLNTFKEAILRILRDELENQPEQLLQEFQKVDVLLEKVVLYIFESFMQTKEQTIERQTQEIAELSTPVLQVWDGILSLPIIGTLDSARTQRIMENLLHSIVETGSQLAILDISGVPMVDTLVAQHLMKTVSAARLMGAECIISGIRPEIAQTIVQLGIDLSGIKTKASMAEALKLAFEILGLNLIPNEKKRMGA